MMNFFKKPAVAIIISAILVLASTFFSINTKLGKKCEQVNDIFYSGMTYSREFHPAIADQLKAYCDITDDVCLIASGYGVDTESLKDCCEWLETALVYSPRNASYIYTEYSALENELRRVIYELDKYELSDRHSALISEHEQQIKTLDKAIYSAGYNEAVRDFRQKYDRFPTNLLAAFARVSMPEYFA